MRVTASALSFLAALSFLLKGISAEEDICSSFQGVNAAVDALTWCDNQIPKCCTDDDGNVSANACGNWGLNAEYNLCKGSCRGTNSCLNMLTNNAAPGSSISIKEEACVSNSLNVNNNLFGVCEHFAYEADGVVNATIGKSACSGGVVACGSFARFGSGDITVDIQDGACYGEVVCRLAFIRAGPGSSILIKEGGCVGDGTCDYFATEVDGIVTASIGKGACSGGEQVCNNFSTFADKVVMIDIQDEACSGGDQACYHVGRYADNLQSLTVPAGECSTENACNLCGSQNNSDGGLAITTECCNDDTTANVDDACHYSDAPSIVPSMSSHPSSVPSSDDGKKKKAKGGKATKNKKTKQGEKASQGKKTEKGEKATKV